MGVRKTLVCVEAGVCVQAGELFPVLGENGSVWEILLGGSYSGFDPIDPDTFPA